MRRLLITIYFDIEDDRPDEDRDYDRFILEVDSRNFRRRLFEIFDEKKYSWDDYQKFKRGYKPIMSIDQLDLTDLDVFTANEFSIGDTNIEEIEI
ncbi:hypothetical protein [Schnuerera sp.]|jgi:hypothetical protein|uniref:hypothetical protein n=1 Tax=Schnuerera sp. TaxID=2794844 RepID=UPI002BD498C8|nr:hypothetical protein [Schnuerera sp.]MCK9443802.1 hypothetical protein [Tissierellaceae bacterium]HSH34951.1 hypothetical protein [Schnuerera sp.]